MKTKRFVVEIELENDAFRDTYHSDREVARILRAVADRVEHDGVAELIENRIVDCNGNTCGFFYQGRERKVTKPRVR